MSPTSVMSLPVPQSQPRMAVAANFMWSLAGIAGSAAAQWALIALLARLGNATVVGAYALALAIAAPVFVLASLHLRTVQCSDVQAEFCFSTYFTLRLISTSIAVVVLAIAVVLLDALARWALAGLILSKAFESVSDVLYGRVQREERMARIGQSMLWRAAGSLLAMYVAMRAGLGMPAGVWMCAGVAGLVAGYDLHLAVRDFPDEVQWNLRGLRALASKAAPLGLLLLMVSLNANVPRYFLAQSFTVREVGIFAALSYVAFAANTVVMAMGQAVMPSLARAFTSRAESAFRRRAASLLAVAAVLGVVGIAASDVAGQMLIGLLYGPEFAAENESFRWMMIGGALAYLASAFGYLLSAVRCFRPQLPICAAALTITVLGCYLFVPTGGLVSAAKAQAAAAGLQFLLSVSMLISCLRTQFGRPS
jgi:O-antigen/teichoic acid export membrane protein